MCHLLRHALPRHIRATSRKSRCCMMPSHYCLTMLVSCENCKLIPCYGKGTLYVFTQSAMSAPTSHHQLTMLPEYLLDASGSARYICRSRVCWLWCICWLPFIFSFPPHSAPWVALSTLCYLVWLASPYFPYSPNLCPVTYTPVSLLLQPSVLLFPISLVSCVLI